MDWNAEGYAANARFVSDLGAPVLDLLAPQPGERILDLGCGDGALTAKLAERGAAVVGVDASDDMVRAARERGLDAQVRDARCLAFDREFDAVFSNAALHWMPEIDPVLESVARALRPGGRFVGEMGGFGNVAAISVALRTALRLHGYQGDWTPWYYPTPQEFRSRLEAHGFETVSMDLFARQTPLPTGMTGWLETFAKPFLDGRHAADRTAILRDAEELLRPALRDSSGRWIADYVRLRFAARLRSNQ